MSASKALSIIDRHFVRPSKTFNEHDGFFIPPMHNSDTRFSLNRTLPAFMVEWRGGPSPYDSHLGDCRTSAAELWENNVCFDLFVDDEKIPDSELGPLKGHKLLDVVDEGEVETVVKKNYFRVQVVPDQVHLNPLGTLAETTAKYNPQKDRQCVERERDAAHTENFFRHLRSQKFTYNTSCLHNYPHGALGIVESPYGDPGEIYVKQQRRLEEAKRRAEHTMRGQNASPPDHLLGALKVRDDDNNSRLVRRRNLHFPECSLFGGVNLLQKEDGGESSLSTSLEQRCGRFRSLNAPKDHLMGPVFVVDDES